VIQVADAAVIGMEKERSVRRNFLIACQEPLGEIASAIGENWPAWPAAVLARLNNLASTIVSKPKSNGL